MDVKEDRNVSSKHSVPVIDRSLLQLLHVYVWSSWSFLSVPHIYIFHTCVGRSKPENRIAQSEKARGVLSEHLVGCRTPRTFKL